MCDNYVSKIPIWAAKIRKNIRKHQLSMLKPYGLSNIHAMYLAALLKEEDGLTMNELCDKLGVTKANTSRAVSDLIEKGYLKKEYANTSCFKYKAVLTESGKKAAAAVADDMKQLHEALLKDVTEEEKETIRAVMYKIAKAAEQLNQ